MGRGQVCKAVREQSIRFDPGVVGSLQPGLRMLCSVNNAKSGSPGTSAQSQLFASYCTWALARYLPRPLPLDLTSCRVRIPGEIRGMPNMDFTIDIASDMPYISDLFVRSHPVLKMVNVHPAPFETILLRSTQGSNVEILGYIQVHIGLGASQHVEQ